MTSLSVQDLNDKVSANEKLCLLDVRHEWEYQLCAFPNSLHIPLQELEERLIEIPKENPVIVVCHHGIRSLQAVKLLTLAGFQRVCNLEGGIHAWATQIDTSVKVY